MSKISRIGLALLLSVLALDVRGTTPALTQAIPSQSLTAGGGSVTVDLRNFFGLPGVTGQVVQVDSSMGKFNVEMFPAAAPISVANFLGYVDRGDYDYAFIHRSEANFVIQGGGYYYYQSQIYTVPAQPAIALEYNLPNTRGTIAMARTSELNSATSQWFINTVDNTATLGQANGGGYAVFGRVIGTGMTVVDAISALGRYNLYPQYGTSHPFTTVPLEVVNGLSYLVEYTIKRVPIYPESAETASILQFGSTSSATSVVTTTLSGSNLVLTPVGTQGTATVTVTATDTNGNQATASFQVTVGKQAQTITFARLVNVPFTRTPLTLLATASSGLPVTFSVLSGPATVSGNALTLTGTGIVTVRASQAGDGSFEAATVVERSFLVTANFASWQSQYFTTQELASAEISGPNAVLNGDGVSNFLKYALGFAPRTAVATALPQAAVQETSWTFTYSRPSDRTEIVYTAEFSTDLANWSSNGVVHTLLSTVDGRETWRAQLPLSVGGVVFFRLSVAVPVNVQ